MAMEEADVTSMRLVLETILLGFALLILGSSAALPAGEWLLR